MPVQESPSVADGRRSAVRQTYELWAETYDRSPNPVLALEERYLEPMLVSFAGKTVADLGCGTGRWLAQIARGHPGKYVGLDLSEGMLRCAARKDGLAGHLIQADCCALPLASESIDVVLCSLLAGYVDLGSLAAEVERIARSGADIYISEFHPDASVRGWKRAVRSEGGALELPARPCAPEEVEAAFVLRGFRVVGRAEFCFGEPERAILVAGGKAAEFESLKQIRAMFICHLRKAAKPKRRAQATRREHRPAKRPEKLWLCGARVAVSAVSAVAADVEIVDGRIRRIVPRGDCRSEISPSRSIDLKGYLLLPGLINSHDHLEFNLFPRLGRGTYANAQEWAQDIYHPETSPVREHLEVPKDIRLRWGGVKNLLCGVTTVCHHNQFQPQVFENDFPVRVVSRYRWGHSLAFGEPLGAAFHSGDGGGPFIVHLGEGTDSASREEIFALDRRGLLGPATVVVHGVGLDAAGQALLKERGAALIWCPTSNLFTLGKTLDLETVVNHPRLALASDSALTAADLMNEIRVAYQLGVSAERIYALVTSQAASALQLKGGEGTLQTGVHADVIAIADCGQSPALALVDSAGGPVDMALLDGRPHLLSRELLASFPPEDGDGLSRIHVEGTERWVCARISQLIGEAKRALGEDLRLAGKTVAA